MAAGTGKPQAVVQQDMMIGVGRHGTRDGGVGRYEREPERPERRSAEAEALKMWESAGATREARIGHTLVTLRMRLCSTF